MNKLKLVGTIYRLLGTLQALEAIEPVHTVADAYNEGLRVYWGYYSSTFIGARMLIKSSIRNKNEM